MDKIKLCVIYFLFLSFLTIQLFSKSQYTDGNYSEYGGCNRMCMRCHMGNLNPKGVGLRLSTNRTTINAGDTLTIFAKISNFSKSWNPGLSLNIDAYSQFAAHTPQEYGWEVVINSNYDNFCFFKISNKSDSVFFWTLRAPSLPGIYTLAASGYFSDLSTGKPVQGTKRGDNSLVITVNKASDSIAPKIENISFMYKNFIIIKASKPIDSSDAANKVNYMVSNQNIKQLRINSISQSRDKKTIILNTDDQLMNDKYNIVIRNLKDYSLIPNNIEEVNETGISPDFKTPYKIYAEWTGDVDSTELKDQDMTEFVGNNDGLIYRTNLCFFLPDNPVDLLPVSGFVTAKLCLTQKAASNPVSQLQYWNVHKLLPGTNSQDYVGNNQSAQINWSGYNQVSPPISSIQHSVSTNDSASYLWVWDITSDFKTRFARLGGSGTNSSDYFLRIKAETENSYTGGVGFYGSDADSKDQIPYIALEFDTTSIPSSIPEKQIINENSCDLKVNPNPVKSTFEVQFNIPESGDISLSIFDLSGNLIRKFNYRSLEAGFHSCNIDINDLQAGTYFIELNAGQKQVVKEFQVPK